MSLSSVGGGCGGGCGDGSISSSSIGGSLSENLFGVMVLNW